MMKNSINIFSWPREVVFGNNALLEVGKHAQKLGAQKAMVVTDPLIRQFGLIKPLLHELQDAEVEYCTFEGIQKDGGDEGIADGLKQYREEGCDLLIAVGGGSVIDTTKAIGILSTNGGSILNYEGIDQVLNPLPLLFVVPTTAGNGSEVSQFCVVLDTHRKVKAEIFSRLIIPTSIFIDPMLMVTKPQDLTATCGMDALANAIEAYLSTWATPLTDALSLHSIQMISETLRPVVANGRDLKLRETMAIASFEAGLALTNAQCGAVHALAHPLAGRFGLEQRLGDAILLPHVMRFNMNANMERLVEIAKAMGEPVGNISKRDGAERAIRSVQRLLVDIGIPTSLERLGVHRDSIPELTSLAVNDPFLRTNPRLLSHQDVEGIYQEAFLNAGWGSDSAPFPPA